MVLGSVFLVRKAARLSVKKETEALFKDADASGSKYRLACQVATHQPTRSV